MSSLVEELQRDALMANSSVTTLLRKARVVATKLDLADFLEWIKLELDGYPGGDVPNYRKTSGRLKAWNPYRGWIPLQFEDMQAARAFCSCNLSQKIAELEILAESKSSTLSVQYTSEQMSSLMNGMEMPMEPRLEISGTVPAAVLDAVRNIILDWSLALEKSGVKGEGMSFSDDDKKKAHSPQISYTIGSIANFTGNTGTVTDRATVHATSSQNLDRQAILKLSSQLEEHRSKFGLSPDAEGKLTDTLAKLNTEMEATNPKRGGIGKLLEVAKSILVSGGSRLLVAGALAEIDKVADHISHS